MAAHRPLIVWSSDALADLSGIWDFYADVAGSHAADKMIRRIEQACRRLENHPFAGRPRDELWPGLRSVVATPHIVFYRVRRDAAEIVRVLDARRDIDEIFAHEPGGK